MRLTFARRLGVLGAIGLLAALISSTAALVFAARVSGLEDEEREYQRASQLVRELDTRSSELKVDGYKALLRPDPAGEREELQDDGGKVTERLDALDGLALRPGDQAVADRLRQSFAAYGAGIRAIIERAVADQASARSDYEAIQKANDATDEAVGAASGQLDASRARVIAENADTMASARLVMALVLVVAALTVLVSTVLLSRSSGRRAAAMVDALNRVADGDLTPRLRDTGSDEIGEMGRALDRAADGITRVFTRVGGSAGELNRAAVDLSRTATQVGESAQQVSRQAGVVAQTADEVSQNVQAVAAGGEEMGVSISEIARNAQEAARVATGAVQAVEATSGTMGKLGESSREIGDVVRLITSIAEQTNLLALNATIEAARAGDAGKGFAVVADEVKQLAQETARATEDISRRVETIQQDADLATAAISGVAGVISQINEFQTTIASAVEEQTATTHAMNAGIGDAANGSGRIAGSISGVAETAGSTAESMAEALTRARELSRISEDLAGLMSGYRLS